jgi:hypothetical protein
MNDRSSTPPIFLHSAFRSGSTWFWNRFRETTGVHAYYEPFNEIRKVLTPEKIAENRADTWNSNHPPLSHPYNIEYLGMLRPEGGVRHFDQDFAYNSYYATKDGGEGGYVAALVEYARSLGKAPVFGFTRSLGRLPWLKGVCPGLHIVTLRDPWDQWASVVRQAAQGNSYFEFHLYLIAFIGRHLSVYREFFDGLILPKLVGKTRDERVASLEFLCQATPIQTRFRMFLRVYLLDALLALPPADCIIDLDRMSAEADYCEETTLRLRQMTKLADLRFDDCTLPHHQPDPDPAYRAALQEALTYLDRRAEAESPPTTVLRAKLESALARFPVTTMAPVDDPSAWDRLFTQQVSVAIELVARSGGRTEKAMAYLQETFGGDLGKHKARLADIAQTAVGQETSGSPARSAERLRQALMTAP